MIRYLKQHPLFSILFLAFFLRFSYFIAIAILNPDGFYMYDSYGYWQIAFNIKEYGIFSQSYDIPIEPDYYRTPIYPLFILVAESIKIETFPVIFLQLVIGTLTCWYTFKISELITNNKFISHTAALIVALDVPSIVMNNIVMTETLFSFLLLLTVYFFLKYLSTGMIRYLLFSSVLCGVSILCRPIGFFIPFFMVSFLLFAYKKDLLKACYRSFIYLIIVLFTVSPWLIRNKFTFGHYFLSVIREHDMQNYQAAAIYAEKNHLSLATAQSALRWKTFKAFKGDANKQPYEYARFIENDAINIAFSEPLLLIKHHAEQFIHFFLKPCRAYIDIQLGNWGIGYNTIPKDYPIFKYLFEHNSKFTISIVFFQLGMMLLVYLSCLFSFLYFKKNKQFLYFILLCLLIFCFANLTLPYVTESRFRIPVVPFISILSASGVYWIFNRFYKK